MGVWVRCCECGEVKPIVEVRFIGGQHICLTCTEKLKPLTPEKAQKEK